MLDWLAEVVAGENRDYTDGAVVGVILSVSMHCELFAAPRSPSMGYEKQEQRYHQGDCSQFD